MPDPLDEEATVREWLDHYADLPAYALPLPSYPSHLLVTEDRRRSSPWPYVAIVLAVLVVCASALALGLHLDAAAAEEERREDCRQVMAWLDRPLSQCDNA